MEAEPYTTSIRELSAALNVPGRTLYWNIAKGYLPAARLGRGRLLIEVADLKAWRKSRERAKAALSSCSAPLAAVDGGGTR